MLRFGAGRFAKIDCCGPGEGAARNWVNALKNPGDQRVILVGVAGGLSPRARPGKAFVISDARNASDNSSSLKPGMTSPRGITGSIDSQDSSITATACSTNVPVTTIIEKHDLHQRTNADLVDMESFAFAQTAEARGIPWSIIRGVSDGPNDILPAAMTQFVDARGRTQIGPVLWNLLKRPALLKDMLRLRRASIDSMRAATALLREIYQSLGIIV